MSDERLLVGAGTALWCDLVRAGERHVQTELSEDAESYLVFVLLRHLKDAPLLGRVMALEWLNAVDASGSERRERLRDVGDRCLLVAGLFPQLAWKRRVGNEYFVSIGRGAYAGVACAAPAGYAALFSHLAQTYTAMVKVLSGVAALARQPVAAERFSLPAGLLRRQVRSDRVH